MGFYTSFMVSLLEYSQIASILAVVVTTSLMLVFILRVVSLDLLNAFPGGIVRVPQTSHRINMERQSLDVIFQILETTKNTLRMKLKVFPSNQSVTLRAYWGVDISTFHHVLRSPWPWFLDAFAKGNLFGAEACLVLDPILKINILEEETDIELEMHKVDLGQAPRTKYPLVIVAKCNDSENFNINVIHVEDKSFMSFPTHILGQYVKLIDSRVTHLVPIYSSNDTSECVVCISRPATRVTLPCRHSSTCGKCFVKLPQGRCPICRGQIQSYFLIGQEDLSEEDEEEVSLQSQPLSWRQRFADLEHRFAMAVGLQEND